MKIKMTGAVAALLLALPMAAHAEGDAANGEKVFNKCKICHAVGPDAEPKATGPVLNGVIGRKPGTDESYANFKGKDKYSKAMKEKGEELKAWSEETIAAYLENPKEFVPKNRMAFVGLKKEQDRADVIAYIKQFSK
jgi:cytochrome c